MRYAGPGISVDDLSTFCKLGGYRLGSIFVDRGVADHLFARTGFTDLLATVRLSDTHAVVMPTLDHLSTQVFIRDALKRMIELLGVRVFVAYQVDGNGLALEEGTDLGRTARCQRMRAGGRTANWSEH